MLWPGFSVTMPVSIDAPLFAEGIGEVELVFDGDEVLGGRRVGLDGLDLRREAFDADAVLGGRIEDVDRGRAVLPVQLAPVVVVEVLVRAAAARCAQIDTVRVTGTSLPVGKTLS